MRSALAVALLTTLVVSSSEIRAADARRQDPQADPIAIGFEWERGAGAVSCKDGESLQRAAEKLLGRRAFVPRDQANVMIRGSVSLTKDATAYRAHLWLVAGDGHTVGERELKSETSDCASLDDPLALVLALAADTLRAMPRAVLRIQPSRPKVEWSGDVAAIGVSAWGILPSRGAGFGLRGGIWPPGFLPIEAGVVWFLPEFQQTPTGQGGDFRATDLRLSLCPPLVAGSIAKLRACGDVGAVLLGATGVAFERTRSPTSVMWGLGPRIDVPVSVGRYFAIEPSAGALFPIVRDRFYYVDEAQQPQVVHQPARAILWLELGLVLKIP